MTVPLSPNIVVAKVLGNLNGIWWRQAFLGL